MKITRILVPIDFSTSSRAAVDAAMTLGARYGASVDVLHVHEDGPEERAEAEAKLERFIRTMKAPEGVTLTSRVEMGPAAPVILKLAEEADMIVMGTRGRSPISQAFLGSVTRAVMRNAPVPVVGAEDDGVMDVAA